MYGRKRPNDFHLRLSDAEYADLLEKAAKVGIGPQAYIHAVLKGKELKEKPTAELIEILKNFSQIKNSMYTIAMKATEIDHPEKEAMWKRFNDMESLTHELLTFMYGE